MQSACMILYVCIIPNSLSLYKQHPYIAVIGRVLYTVAISEMVYKLKPWQVCHMMRRIMFSTSIFMHHASMDAPLIGTTTVMSCRQNVSTKTTMLLYVNSCVLSVASTNDSISRLLLHLS